VATKDQQDELASVVNSMNKSAAKYKRLLLVDKKKPSLVDAIKNAEHDVVLPVEGFDPSEAGQYEVGGITPQMIEQAQISRNRLQNASGIDDAIRGNVTGEGTATEHSIAEGAATTRLALLTSPLRDRFGVVQRMEFYSVAALNDIVLRAGKILGVELTPEGAREIATRGRGTPRIVNRLLRRVRDYAQVVADGVITQDVANIALTTLEVDHLGLDENDRRLLRAIIDLFNGGPVGLSTLAASLSEEIDAVEDVYEPFLLQLGMLQRTPRGRIVTPRAYEHLGLGIPAHLRDPKAASEQKRLF
jgi:hypothetical protein